MSLLDGARSACVVHDLPITANEWHPKKQPHTQELLSWSLTSDLRLFVVEHK